jgi:TadE-like protein
VNPHRDRGAIDVSIQMLFGFVALVLVMLALFEATAYWHARNVFDEAASEGVRIAAAFDGTCDDGVAAARQLISREAGGWASDVEVSCVTGPVVVVSVTGRTPGVVGDAFGALASVSESAPKES